MVEAVLCGTVFGLVFFVTAVWAFRPETTGDES